MAKQHVDLMKGLGYSDEQIKSIEEMKPEDAETFKPEEMVTVVQNNLKTKFSNDPEFLATIPEDKLPKTLLKKIESGQYARFQNELVEVATKQLGLEDKELTDEDRKSIKGLALKIATTHLQKKGGAEGLQKMQTELSAALQSVETLKDQHKTNLTEELAKVNGTHNAKLIRVLAKVELQGLDDISLAVPANIISDPALQALGEKYLVVLDANENLDIKQKDNPALDVIDKAGKKVTFNQALKEVVLEKKLGTVKEEEKDPKNGKKKVIIDGGGDGKEGVVEVPDYIKNKMVEEKEK